MNFTTYSINIYNNIMISSLKNKMKLLFNIFFMSLFYSFFISNPTEDCTIKNIKLKQDTKREEIMKEFFKNIHLFDLNNLSKKLPKLHKSSDFFMAIPSKNYAQEKDNDFYTLIIEKLKVSYAQRFVMLLNKKDFDDFVNMSQESLDEKAIKDFVNNYLGYSDQKHIIRNIDTIIKETSLLMFPERDKNVYINIDEYNHPVAKDKSEFIGVIGERWQKIRLYDQIGKLDSGYKTYENNPYRDTKDLSVELSRILALFGDHLIFGGRSFYIQKKLIDYRGNPDNNSIVNSCTMTAFGKYDSTIFIPSSYYRSLSLRILKLIGLSMIKDIDYSSNGSEKLFLRSSNKASKRFLSTNNDSISMQGAKFLIILSFFDSINISINSFNSYIEDKSNNNYEPFNEIAPSLNGKKTNIKNDSFFDNDPTVRGTQIQKEIIDNLFNKIPFFPNALINQITLKSFSDVLRKYDEIDNGQNKSRIANLKNKFIINFVTKKSIKQPIFLNYFFKNTVCMIEKIYSELDKKFKDMKNKTFKMEDNDTVLSFDKENMYKIIDIVSLFFSFQNLSDLIQIYNNKVSLYNRQIKLDEEKINGFSFSIQKFMIKEVETKSDEKLEDFFSQMIYVFESMYEEKSNCKVIQDSAKNKTFENWQECATKFLDDTKQCLDKCKEAINFKLEEENKNNQRNENDFLEHIEKDLTNSLQNDPLSITKNPVVNKNGKISKILVILLPVTGMIFLKISDKNKNISSMFNIAKEFVSKIFKKPIKRTQRKRR